MATTTTTTARRIPLTTEDGFPLQGAALYRVRGTRYALVFDVDCEGEVLADPDTCAQIRDAMARAVGPVHFLDRGEQCGEEVYETALEE